MKTLTQLCRRTAFFIFATLSVVEVHAAAGDLYFSSFTNGTIRRRSSGGQVSPSATMLLRPAGLAFDRAGNLFVAEGSANRISKITPGGTKTTFASGLNGPQSLVFDNAGNLFGSDLNGNVIYKFAPDGGQTTFANNLNGPSGLAFNSAGELFESDVRGGTINRFSTNGTKTPFASGIDLPTGVAVDRFGNVFVAEFNKHRVIKFAPDGTPLPFDLVLNRPFVLLFDPAGKLLIADNEGGAVFSYNPDDGKTSLVTDEDAPSGLAIEPATSLPLNISTRLRVLTGDNVLIGGFIITGTDPKKVIIRGIGPSLSQFFAGVLDDPTLELFQGDTLLGSNNDWKETQAEVEATGIPPTNDKESAIVRTLAPGSYTAVLRGNGQSTGIGVVEAYDLDQGASSQLANIASRGFVDTGNSVMICGFIVGPGTGARVLLRGIGPSLAAAGVSGALANPTLELRDQNGALVKGNDDWKSNQASEIQAAGLAPADDLEAALIATLPGGNYTGILAGAAGGNGIGLIELYNLR